MARICGKFTDDDSSSADDRFDEGAKATFENADANAPQNPANIDEKLMKST